MRKALQKATNKTFHYKDGVMKTLKNWNKLNINNPMPSPSVKKKCKHTATFGQVGAETYLCLECQEMVKNKSAKEDRKTLNKTLKKKVSRIIFFP